MKLVFKKNLTLKKLPREQNSFLRVLFVIHFRVYEVYFLTWFIIALSNMPSPKYLRINISCLDNFPATYLVMCFLAIMALDTTFAITDRGEEAHFSDRNLLLYLLWTERCYCKDLYPNI